MDSIKTMRGSRPLRPGPGLRSRLGSFWGGDHFGPSGPILGVARLENQIMFASWDGAAGGDIADPTLETHIAVFSYHLLKTFRNPSPQLILELL